MPRFIDPKFKLKLATLFTGTLPVQPGLLNRNLRGVARVADPQLLKAAAARADQIVTLRRANIDKSRAPDLVAKLAAMADKRKAVGDSVRQRLQALKLRAPATVLAEYGVRLAKANPERTASTMGGFVIRAGMKDAAAVQDVVGAALGLTAAAQEKAGMTTRVLPVENHKGGTLFEVRFAALSSAERRELHNVGWALRKARQFDAVRVSASPMTLFSVPTPVEMQHAQRVFAWHLEAIRVPQAHAIGAPAGGQERGGGAVIAHLDTGWTPHTQYNEHRIDQARSHNVITGQTGGNAAKFSSAMADKDLPMITHGLATGSLMVGGRTPDRSGVATNTEAGLTFALTPFGHRDYLTAPPEKKIITRRGRLTGVAPEATVLPIKFIPDAQFDADASGFHGTGVFHILNPHMIDAAEYARQQHADVISMSVGAFMLDAFKQKIDDLVHDDGIIVIAAAGQTYSINAVSGLASALALMGLQSDDSVVEPAAFSNVIAVAGSTADMRPWLESH